MSTPETAKGGGPSDAAKKPETTPPVKKASGQAIVLGFDFGTNKSCLIYGIGRFRRYPAR